MRVRACLLLAVGLWLLCAVEALAFDPLVIGQTERLVAGLRDELTRVEQTLQLPALNDDQISGARRELEDIRSRAVAGSLSLDGPIVEVTQQLASLGPAPASGQSEPEVIADRRDTLTSSLSRLQSAKKQLDVTIVETEQQIDRTAASQRNQFFQRIFEPSRSILNPQLWYEGGLGFAILIGRLGGLIGSWWTDISVTANFALLMLAPSLLAALIILYRITRRWLLARYGSLLRLHREPDETDRLWRIVRGTLFAFVAVSALVVIFLFTLRAAHVLTPRFEQLFKSLAEALIFAVTMGTAATRIAASGESHWRIIDVDDRAAGRLAFLAVFAAVLSAAEKFTTELSAILYLPIGFSVAQSALFALIMIVTVGAITIILTNQEGRGDETGGEHYFTWVRPFVPLTWLIIGTSAAALLLGYIAFAGFIAQQLIDTAYLVVSLFLVHHLSEALVVSSLDPKSRVGRALRRITGLGSRGVARFGLMMRTIIDLALAFVGVPLLLLNWTVTWIDFGSWFDTLLIGFKIGNVTVSLSSVFLVLTIVVAGVLITKLLMRWLDTRVLAQTQIDRGVRDSIGKGVSYAGYIIAAGFAFSAAGFGFSNIVIIAGALGIGIGFGLQSIVNNFISGLILLVERPVRVGDWVQLTSGEGIVRRINVRSTEIETFDSCTIIVPNSSLITEAVKNWTHDDTIARFRITLSAPYDSDADFIKDTMLKLAKDHALVLHRPEPKVLLTGFSTATLDFELRAFVGDALNAVDVASDIRFALWAAVRQKGIGIVVPVVYDVRIVDGSLPSGPPDAQTAGQKP
jgi:potassium-dependent mechanosensitive channel